MDLNLRGKVALVTGGSRGLGCSVCRGLAAEGARVAVNYRQSSERADHLVAELRTEFGVDAISVRADVACEAEVQSLFERVEADLSRVEILINNAAVCPTSQVKALSEHEWTETLNTNLKGSFLTCREFVRRAESAGCGGRIVNVASAAAFLGSTTGHAPYDASKGGLISFTISLAREVAPLGIAVNAVAPGMMYTEMTAGTLDANEAKYLARIPLRRIGKLHEVADVVVFLASKCASYMTGSTVDVSGGLLMR